ncbi:hypothetical protein HY546_01040, partial [archaeon]|nr:hypothetical protein [archaeon]
GAARSGKDAVAEVLRDELGFQLLVFSDILKEECVKIGLDPSEKLNLTRVAGDLRKKHGRSVLGKLIVDLIRPPSVIVGARSPEEVTEIRAKFPAALLVEVHAEPKIRFARRKAGDPPDWETFFSRDLIDEEKYGMRRVFEMADRRIENNGTLEELKEKTRALMRELGITKR